MITTTFYYRLPIHVFYYQRIFIHGIKSNILASKDEMITLTRKTNFKMVSTKVGGGGLLIALISR